MREIEYPPGVVDDQFDEIPEPGEKIWFGDGEYVVLRTNIINEKKLHLQIMQRREVRVFDDFQDYSIGWEGESEVINEYLRKQGDAITIDDIE